METDQHNTAVLIRLFQVLLMNLPVSDRRGFTAGSEARHFDGLGCDVAGVVAMENPGGVGDAVAYNTELLRRRGQLVFDLCFDSALGDFFNHRTPFRPYFRIDEMRRRCP